MLDTSSRRWAESEFEDLDVGDERRRQRTISLATAAFESPGGCIPQVVESSAEREAAFRWVRNSAVTNESLMAAIASSAAKRCAAYPFVYVALDQTSITLVDKQKSKGFGHVGRSGIYRLSRGLQAMTALAISPSGSSLGIVAQSWWARAGKCTPEYQDDRRPLHKRESHLWSACITSSLQAFESAGSPSYPWYQLDRGGDSYQVLTLADEYKLLVTVRSAYNRRLAGDEPRYLHSCFEGEKSCSFISLQLTSSRAKRLGRRPRRPIRLALSYKPVELDLRHPVTNSHCNVSLTAVRVREYRPPAGCERLEWWLLTTAPVATIADAEQVVYGYTLRWRIEEFHRTWKSGACSIQSSQLRSRGNFQRWATLLATVAARIERLKFLARNEPETMAEEVLSRDEIDAAILISKTTKFARGQPLNIKDAVHLIAIVGGYGGNTKAGPPGSVTIRRGLEKVVMVAVGIQLGRNL